MGYPPLHIELQVVTARLDIDAGSPADPQVIGPIGEPSDGSPLVGGLRSLGVVSPRPGAPPRFMFMTLSGCIYRI